MKFENQLCWDPRRYDLPILTASFLREIRRRVVPAPGRRPGQGTFCQSHPLPPPPPPPFPIHRTISPRRPSVVIHGFPLPSRPCPSPSLVLSVGRLSALLISQSYPIALQRSPVQDEKIRRCKYGCVSHTAPPALLALLTCLYHGSNPPILAALKVAV